MLCMSAGWGDAAILVPYVLYKRTGDRKILADNYEMMQKWYGFLLGRAQQTTGGTADRCIRQYTVLNGLDYGEWCEPGIYPMQAMMNPRKSVGDGVSGLFRAASGRNCTGAGQGRGRSAVPRHGRKAVKAYRRLY